MTLKFKKVKCEINIELGLKTGEVRASPALLLLIALLRYKAQDHRLIVYFVPLYVYFYGTCIISIMVSYKTRVTMIK